MSKIDEIMEAFEIEKDETEPQLDDSEIEDNANEFNENGLEAEVKESSQLDSESEGDNE